MPARRRKDAKQPAPADVSALFEPYVWEWFERTFGEPSPPQAASWPRIAQGKNTLIFSPTGSGKTLAAFLWCINDLFRLAAAGELTESIHVLYLSPLKALNNDIQRNLLRPLVGIRRRARRAGVRMPDIRSEVRTGDTPQQKRAQMVRRPPHILITTPESLFIILATQKFRERLRTVRTVIVDEIHAISDNKRGVHLSLSLERLEHLVGRRLVRIGLSATQRPLETIARFLVGRGGSGRARPCEIVDVGARKDLNVQVISPVDNLLEAPFDAIWGSSYEKMLSMIGGHDTTLIFTNSRYKTERTALRLNELAGDRGAVVGAHHGSMSKQVRLSMEDDLKRGRLDALVATSSLELGIDVGSIDLVCQIESPKSVSRGLQRIGRAGHLLDATSEGRLIVTDRDDLVESAVLVRAVMDGLIDTTRVPENCLDVLAQQIVGAVAADDWPADDLYRLCRRSYCYRKLTRATFDRVLAMLAGEYGFDMDQAPFPKLLWDRVHDVLRPERGARMIAFRAGGTIPDVANYDVYFEARKTKVGQLDEGFVEELRGGDIFVLGSSTWRVIGIRRNRVLVEDVYGKAPTIPFWYGDRSSRTADLGQLVGAFRREMAEKLLAGDAVRWLMDHYYVDENGAKSIHEYFREQQLATGDVPSDVLVLVEHFRDELGQKQIVIHSSFGIRVNETWALALAGAVQAACGFRPQTATVDDGILLTLPKGKKLPLGPKRGSRLLDLVTPANVGRLLDRAVADSPVFASRFRHNAVRSLLVLRDYQGRKTPVWLQSLRASALLDACRGESDFPVVAETLRECLHESLDAAGLRNVLRDIRAGPIKVRTLQTRVPSPFTHSLLLLGQYGQMGAIPTRERRSRLMHLHRELLRQILDEETLRNLLDPRAVEAVEGRIQFTDPRRRARNANELARALGQLGDLVEEPDEEISLLDRAGDGGQEMLDRLAADRRAVCVPLPTVETSPRRWIATENFPLYRAAFAAPLRPAAADRKLLRALTGDAPRPLSELRLGPAGERRLERLVAAYEVLRFGGGREAAYVAAAAWVPPKILGRKLTRPAARRELVARFLRRRGPVTKYEVMERYGLPGAFVEQALADLHRRGQITQGEYVPTKSFPQWCHRPNLEEIHRLTLNRLRREMEPASADEYADFLIRWQHAHPETRLSGLAGLRQVIAQLQGLENYQGLYESDVFPLRVAGYDASLLDSLCYGGEVIWRRFDVRHVKAARGRLKVRRGRIGFGLRGDADWLLTDPKDLPGDLDAADEDIPDACRAVREHLAGSGACFFDDVVEATGLDWRIALRAIWHLVWTGEATNDSYESIRHADFRCGLSGCYDLASQPWRKNTSLDQIVRHMLDYRKLDPRLGRWAPTERLVPGQLKPPAPADRAAAWARLLLDRYGIVCRDVARKEVALPAWRDLRRALARMELLGKVRRGFFVMGLAGEQYATPEAVDALRQVKLRHGDDGDGDDDAPDAPAETPAGDEPMLLLNACDPANPFGAFMPLTNEVGEEVRFSRTAYQSLVFQAGRPVVLLTGGVTVLADLSREAMVEALRAALARGPLAVPSWNGHPIDVSPARHLLTTMGFVKSPNRWKGYVHDGVSRPDDRTVAEAAAHVPDLFERLGKEQAPVAYDAEWIISRANEQIRPKVRELIDLLGEHLPAECTFVYLPGQFRVEYRGVRAVNPYIQLKQIWVQVTHKGWTRGLLVRRDTDLGAPEFLGELLKRFENTRRQIDQLLEGRRRPGTAENAKSEI